MVTQNMNDEDIHQQELKKLSLDQEDGDFQKINQNSGVIRLQPKMGLMNGITVIVGCIIGSGIFISPKGVLKGTGSVGLSIIVWISCGIFSMIGAYCYAELGCMITKTGADYAYIMEAFGPFVAFIRLWVECMIVRPCSQAIIALTFSFYVLRPIFPDCDPPDDAVKCLACICICLLTFVNCWNVKWATTVQDVFTYGKLTALAIIIVTGLVMLGKGHVEHFNFNDTESDITKISLSFYSGLFAYSGWNYLNFVIEELKDPHRNLPKAIFISCILVTVVYTLTIVAFHSILSVQDVMKAEAVAVTFAENIYGSWSWIMSVFVALSTFGSVNGMLFTSSRLFYAGAEQGQMPRILSMIQISRMTPAPSVIFMTLLSLIYLCSTNIYALINYVSFATWLTIALAVVCLPYFRWRQPNWPRPVKVCLIFPIIYILDSVFLTIVPIIADPVGTGFGVLITATGVPVYMIFIYWKNKPKWIKNLTNEITRFLQKIMIVIPADKPHDL